MKTLISIYGSHNSAVSLAIDGEIKCVLELERFSYLKNAAFSQYANVNNPLIALETMLKWIKREYGVSKFDKCISMNTEVVFDKEYDVRNIIPAKEYVYGKHHLSHAAGSFYQSSFDKAVVFSFDGGGNDGFFNVYMANRKDGLQVLEQVLNPSQKKPHLHYDLGFPYMVFGHYMKDIRHETLGQGNLSYPGKLMGLASYGKVNEQWLPYFMTFYKMGPNGVNYAEAIAFLGKCIGVVFDEEKRLDGQLAYDIAATSQAAFEECFLEVANPYLTKFPDMPICVAGGCGLNIILNTRLVEEYKRDVFIGPNPNDCGLAVGMLLNELKPEKPVDLTYAGTTLLDIDLLPDYMEVGSVKVLSDINRIEYLEASPSILVEDLAAGKIVGVARGRAEHGPRALGNRSILCNPSIPDMQDILNAKVKNREWYRPFAPVVRREDVHIYFEWDKDATWMSFCPRVQEKWVDQLSAVTHVDGTARVQTVTKEQNEWLYNLITEFQKLTGIGVLLNTSFNVSGKPILSSIKDAMLIYKTTDMDALLIENVYFRKEGFE